MEHHGHTRQKQVMNRLARIEGHVRAVKEMVAEGRDCPDVLLQIAAIRKAIDNTAKVVLQDHLEHCLVHAVSEGQEAEVLRKLQEALDRYLR